METIPHLTNLGCKIYHYLQEPGSHYCVSTRTRQLMQLTLTKSLGTRKIKQNLQHTEPHTDSNAQPEHHCNTVPLTASVDELKCPLSLQQQVMMGIYAPHTWQTNHQLVTSPAAPVVLLSQHLQPHLHHNAITQCKSPRESSPKPNRDGNTKWPQLPVGPPAKNKHHTATSKIEYQNYYAYV